MAQILVSVLLALLSVTKAEVTYLDECPAAFPDPGPCIGGNCSDVQDMSIIRRIFNDNIYFRFWHASHGPNGTGGPEIQEAHSLDISGPWTGSGVPVLNETTAVGTPGPQGDPPNHLFAPDVHLINGKYYMYFTDFNYAPGSDPHGGEYNNINVAVSNDLSAGSWTDMGPIGIPFNQSMYSRLGASLYTNSTPMHLTFGSFNNGIYGINMSSPTSVVANAVPQLLLLNPNLQEGSFQYKYGNYHYLFFSQGNCCPGDNSDPSSAYHIFVCRSLQINGPFTDANDNRCDIGPNPGRTLVLASHGQVYSPGGVGILDNIENGPVMYYQYLNTTIGYGERNLTQGWNPLRFNSTGWPCLISVP